VQRPAPPILMGGTDERKTLRLVALYADSWNGSFQTVEVVMWSSPPDFPPWARTTGRRWWADGQGSLPLHQSPRKQRHREATQNQGSDVFQTSPTVLLHF
jgi:hypothetical protein